MKNLSTAIIAAMLLASPAMAEDDTALWTKPNTTEQSQAEGKVAVAYVAAKFCPELATDPDGIRAFLSGVGVTREELEHGKVMWVIAMVQTAAEEEQKIQQMDGFCLLSGASFGPAGLGLLKVKGR